MIPYQCRTTTRQACSPFPACRHSTSGETNVRSVHHVRARGFCRDLRDLSDCGTANGYSDRTSGPRRTIRRTWRRRAGTSAGPCEQPRRFAARRGHEAHRTPLGIETRALCKVLRSCGRRLFLRRGHDQHVARHAIEQQTVVAAVPPARKHAAPMMAEHDDVRP